MRHFRHHKKEPQNLIKPQIQQTLLQKVALKKEDRDREIKNQLRETKAMLEALGVVVEDLVIE